MRKLHKTQDYPLDFPHLMIFFKLLNRLFHKRFKKIQIKTGSKKSADNNTLQEKLKLRREFRKF